MVVVGEDGSMTDSGHNPLNPTCPCASGMALLDCCASIRDSDHTSQESEDAMGAIFRFGTRGEFASALRRLRKQMLAPLAPEVVDRLLAQREVELQLTALLLTHVDIPFRGDDTIAKTLLRREGPSMSTRARAVLAQWAAQPLSLYEVLEVFPGEGLRLRDRLRKFTVRVVERLGSQQVRPGWFLLARVRLRPDGVPVLDGPLLQFEEGGRDRMLEWLRRNHLAADGAAVRPSAHLAELFRMWQEYMADAMSAPPPRLQNQSGEDLVMCEMTFAVEDAGAVQAMLAKRADWEVDPDDGAKWICFESITSEVRRGLARVAFEAGHASVEANSRERAAMVRTLLEAVPGVRYLKGTETTGVELMARARQRAAQEAPRTEESPLPDGELAEVMARLLDQHYRKWVDSPLPMFSGRTPRQMASIDPAAVSRAIWDIAQPRGGAPAYDADWMYGELGVPRLGAGPFEAGIEP